VAAALAVAEPMGSGLGGGGFFLLHSAADGRDRMVDAREIAPAAATSLALAAGAGGIPKPSLDGPSAAAIPGLPAALHHLAHRYGRLPLTRTLAPAIRLARQGILITPHYQRLAALRWAALQASPAAARIFLLDGAVPPLGARILQPDLAATLATLATGGANAFYRGPLARRLVTGVQAAGGLWSMTDLAAYRVKERRPITGRYRGIEIISASLPASGGPVLLATLGCLEALPKPAAPADDTADPGTGRRHHLLVECLRRAFRVRAAYLGDPDFTAVPPAAMPSARQALEAASSIDLDHATPSAELPPLAPAPPQGDHTSHFSILDGRGNYVAATLSINLAFGAGFVVPGTGILLNDEMDDFAQPALTPNGYGLVGLGANLPSPGKRPLSSMTPTFLRDGKRLAILGTPGGSRIISQMVGAVLAFAEGAGAAAIVARPRIHHQYLPDEVVFEPGALEAAEVEALRHRGHHLKELDRPYGNMQVVIRHSRTGTVEAASDPRGEGAASVW
jgi:gamma-glutamyltranspeptidase/glutathione hydrolase